MVTDEQYKKLLQRVEKLEELYRNWFTLISKLKLEDDFQEMKNARKVRVDTSAGSTVPKRDRTKYKFNGKVYGKRQLVFEVVKQYVGEHPTITYDELQNAFPDYLQGALGVVRSTGAAGRYRGAEKRYYLSDEDLIELHGERYAVCSQWDAKNINAFLNVAKKYYQIEEIIY